MHKIVLEPKDPYELCADGRGADVENVDPECRDHVGVLLGSKDAHRVLDPSPRLVLSSKSAEGRTGVVNNGIFPCRL